MKIKIRHIIACLFLIAASFASIEAEARIAVPDISSRNHENEKSGYYSRQVYIATYLCDIAGYDYILTDNPEAAMEEDLILLANLITDTSFTKEELTAISEWIADGSTIVVPGIRSVASDSKDLISEIFGIDATQQFSKSRNRTLIN